MSNTIHLLGGLEQFGSIWKTSETRISDVIKLIDCQVTGFREYLVDALEAGLEVSIIRNDGLEIDDPREVFIDNAVKDDLYMCLIPSGSGSGWGKILGALVIAAVTFYTFGTSAPLFSGAFAANVTAANIGYAIAVNLALSGVTDLLTKTPKGDKDEKLSSFDGPINNIVAGAPVPILYGELLVGGAPIHVNIGTSLIPAFTIPTPQMASVLGPVIDSPSGSPGALPIMSGSTPGSGNVTPTFLTEDEQELINQILDNLPSDFTAYG